MRITMTEPLQNPTNIWRTAGGDNTRRGLFAKPVEIDPIPKRRLSTQGTVQASVVFDRNSTAYIADMAGGVQAYDTDGNELWHTRLDGGISATPVLHPEDDRLFVGTHTGWVYALKSTNGEPLWKIEIPSKSDPRILSDFLFLPRKNAIVLNSWGGKYYAMNAENGESLFSWDAGITPYAGVASDSNGTIYCLRAVWEKGIEFVRIDPSGKETILYTQPLQKKPASRIFISAAPVTDEDRGIIYFITNLDQESLLHAWQMKTSQLLWTHRFPRNVLATPALMADGTIVTAVLDGFVYAIAPDQTLLYRYASGCEYLLSGAVCDNNGNVYLGDPLGIAHHITRDGCGQPFFESQRAIQSRLSFDPYGNLFVPLLDHSVAMFENKRIE